MVSYFNELLLHEIMHIVKGNHDVTQDHKTQDKQVKHVNKCDTQSLVLEIEQYTKAAASV